MALLRKVFFSILCGVLLASPVSAVEYSGFGGKPAYPRLDNPRTNSIFVHTVTPGQVIEEGVFVINNTGEANTFRVYSADFIPSSGGGFACKQYVDAKEDVGKWLELEAEEVTLENGGNQLVPFTINIPEEIGVGEHNGCILVEEKKEKTDEQAGLTLSFRTGLRVALTVPGKIDKRLKVTEFSVTNREDKSKLLNLSLANAGNVSIDSKVAIKVTDMWGRDAGTFGGEYTILRDDVSELHFEFKQPFWGGKFNAIGTAVYDPRTTIEIGQDDFVNDGIVLDGGEITFYVLPQPKALAVIGLVFLLILIILILFAFRIKQKVWIYRTWGPYKVKARDDIQVIAKRFDVSWRLLVRVNHLKPPYKIKTGDELRVPPKPVKKKKEGKEPK